MSNAASVTTADFDEKVLAASGPVLVDFWATWCGPCRQLAPVLDRFAAANDGKVTVVKVDIDSEPALAARYGVASVPTLLLFKGGEVAAQQVGAKPQPVLQAAFGPHLD